MNPYKVLILCQLMKTIYPTEIHYLCINANLMRAIEFKTIIKNNRIEIPLDIQSELQFKDKANVRVMILLR